MNITLCNWCLISLWFSVFVYVCFTDNSMFPRPHSSVSTDKSGQLQESHFIQHHISANYCCHHCEISLYPNTHSLNAPATTPKEQTTEDSWICMSVCDWQILETGLQQPEMCNLKEAAHDRDGMWTPSAYQGKNNMETKLKIELSVRQERKCRHSHHMIAYLLKSIFIQYIICFTCLQHAQDI